MTRFMPQNIMGDWEHETRRGPMIGMLIGFD